MVNEKPSVTIIYNGLEKSLEYNPEATVRALLDHAIKAFGISQNPHLLALFNQAGIGPGASSATVTRSLRALRQMIRAIPANRM